MTNTIQPKAPAGEANKKAVLKDIHAKWDKFSHADLAALKGRDDLVAQVIAMYGQEKGMVQRDVDALLKGRTI